MSNRLPYGQLPADAEEDLRRALELTGPARLRAIDAARARAEEKYPSLFTRNANMKLLITGARLAFPALFEAQSIEGSEPKYNGRFIIDPADTKTVKELDAAMLAVAEEKWGAKAKTIFDGLTKTGKKPDVCFVKEGYKNRDGDIYDGFEGKFYVAASSAARPLVVDKDRTPLTAADGRPYAGCYVNANIEVWAQDNKFGRGIRANLRGVQFLRDGDAFAGGTPASPDEFEDLSVSGDGEGELA